MNTNPNPNPMISAECLKVTSTFNPRDQTAPTCARRSPTTIMFSSDQILEQAARDGSIDVYVLTASACLARG
jgi:hypothetical protein